VTSFQGKKNVFREGYKTYGCVNQTRWKQTFYTKSVCEDLVFAMMIKKVEISFGVGSKGPKTTDFGGILKFKPLFCQSAPTPPPNVQKRCIWVSYNIPPNFKPKY